MEITSDTIFKCIVLFSIPSLLITSVIMFMIQQREINYIKENLKDREKNLQDLHNDQQKLKTLLDNLQLQSQQKCHKLLSLLLSPLSKYQSLQLEQDQENIDLNQYLIDEENISPDQYLIKNAQMLQSLVDKTGKMGNLQTEIEKREKNITNTIKLQETLLNEEEIDPDTTLALIIKALQDEIISLNKKVTELELQGLH